MSGCGATNTGEAIAWAGLTAPGKAVDFDWVQISARRRRPSIAETWSQIDFRRC